MGLSVGHIILVVIAILVLFGAGRLPKLMEDLAKGMKAFKRGIREEEEATPLPKSTKAISNARSDSRK